MGAGEEGTPPFFDFWRKTRSRRRRNVQYGPIVQKTGTKGFPDLGSLTKKV
jgi:hypothetical protein